MFNSRIREYIRSLRDSTLRVSDYVLVLLHFRMIKQTIEFLPMAFEFFWLNIVDNFSLFPENRQIFLVFVKLSTLAILIHLFFYLEHAMKA